MTEFQQIYYERLLSKVSSTILVQDYFDVNWFFLLRRFSQSLLYTHAHPHTNNVLKNYM